MAEAGAVTNCCAFNQNKMIENAQYKSLQLLRLNFMIFSTQQHTTTHDNPQQITVYCCRWHVCVVTTLTLQLATHLSDILITVT